MTKRLSSIFSEHQLSIVIKMAAPVVVISVNSELMATSRRIMDIQERLKVCKVMESIRDELVTHFQPIYNINNNTYFHLETFEL